MIDRDTFLHHIIVQEIKSTSISLSWILCLPRRIKQVSSQNHCQEDLFRQLRNDMIDDLNFSKALVQYLGCQRFAIAGLPPFPIKYRRIVSKPGFSSGRRAVSSRYGAYTARYLHFLMYRSYNSFLSCLSSYFLLRKRSLNARVPRLARYFGTKTKAVIQSYRISMYSCSLSMISLGPFPKEE